MPARERKLAGVTEALGDRDEEVGQGLCGPARQPAGSATCEPHERRALMHAESAKLCSLPSGLPGSSRLHRTRHAGSAGSVLLLQCRRQQAERAAEVDCKQCAEDMAGSSALSSSLCANKLVEHSELHEAGRCLSRDGVSQWVRGAPVADEPHDSNRAGVSVCQHHPDVDGDERDDGDGGHPADHRQAAHKERH